MQSQDKYRIAVLAAYALALHGFEYLLPTPIPWLRLGLANIITLVALTLFGFSTAMSVTLIRVILASIFTGTFLGPAFLLSFSGGVSSTAAMGLIYVVQRNLFGPVGLSLIGALFHNIAQLTLAYFLFIQRIEAILIISPLVIFIGVLTGFTNGVVADILIKNILKKDGKTIHNVT
ncbi:MAG: Gx transporter family protein [Nitrospiraceae bacterium]|nr:MAG: Gx transporter family protein [Nitrospiraceae bacterium]